MSADDTADTASVEDASGLLPGFLARSFLAKFLLALLLVTVVIVGVSAGTYIQTTEQLNDNTQREYISVANSTATQIEEWRAARADTTQRLAQFPAIRNGTFNERQQFLSAENERLPSDVNRVLLVNRTGATTNVTASTDPAKVGEILNSREAPWVTTWLDNNLTYNDGVFISSATNARGTSLVSFVTPVQTQSGEQILVLQTDFNAVGTDLPSPAPSVYSQVSDEEGRLVADSQGNVSAEGQDRSLEANQGTLPLYTPNASNLTFLQDGLNGNVGFVQGSDVNGSVTDSVSSYVIAYAPVEGANWVVATHVPVSLAYELRTTITQSLLILSGTAFLGIGLIGIVFGRGAVSALNRLTEKANRLEAGNLDVDLEVTRRDEFGQLTASFANMRNALRDRIQEAEAARKEAEVSRSEALAMTEYLQEKAEDYSEVMQQCANGDLTNRMEIDNENDAMDQIAEEFNDMIGELEKTTGQLKTFSEEVAESSDIVLTNTRNVRQSAERVTQSVDAISTDATDQAQRLDELAASMDEVIDRLQTLNGNPHVNITEELEQFESVADVLEEASGQTESIRSEAAEASETSKEQAEQLDEVSERADRLKRYAKPLGGILDRFETAAEHEFVFSGGPSQPVEEDD